MCLKVPRHNRIIGYSPIEFDAIVTNLLQPHLQICPTLNERRDNHFPNERQVDGEEDTISVAGCFLWIYRPSKDSCRAVGREAFPDGQQLGTVRVFAPIFGVRIESEELVVAFNGSRFFVHQMMVGGGRISSRSCGLFLFGDLLCGATCCSNGGIGWERSERIPEPTHQRGYGKKPIRRCKLISQQSIKCDPLLFIHVTARSSTILLGLL